MMVWPDMSASWTEHDTEPDPVHRQRAYSAFDYLDRLRPEDVGAQSDAFDKCSPFLRFDDPARELFKDWRRKLEARLRSDELHPAVESHLAKYRKLVPSLALIHHVVSGSTGPVGVVPVLAALAWADFLESHAHRIYHAGAAATVHGSHAIIRGLRAGKLESPFTVRDITHKNWSPMGDDPQKVRQALELIEEYQWVRSVEVTPGPSGGRPTTRYTCNPKGLAR